MPFMIGPAPIRRTIKYLEAGKLLLKNNIQIFSLNYNLKGDHHEGARQFLFWYMPQLQYKNPNVQIAKLANLTPTPFIKCYYDSDKTMIIDIDGKTKDEILNHLIRVIGKSKKEIEEEAMASQKKENPANIGNNCSKHCICEVLGQVPCPGLVPLPWHLRGKSGQAEKPEYMAELYPQKEAEL